MPVSEHMRAAITLVRDCRTTCMETLYDHCLPMGGAHVAPGHVKAMVDCIEACQACADFMTRASTLHHVQCAACAEICEACASSCASLDSPQMQRCAELCCRCARTCREMSRASVAA